ncbi:MAG: pyridoxamine 5'-phosphate oxidase family protein [Chloroflexi bacterium]|nr:pyridoxamine 5'-phosphate oxidase family protein [Chloroflexota bacterium]MBU1748092.1 pyridoxamine 5'-phosphate oxidase family protein [Chloroflexota bacterium]
MSLLASYPGLLQALSGEMTPKFLASRSAGGVPNLVPVTSIMPAGDVTDRLIFGNFLLRKSIGNLDEDTRVGVLVVTTDLEGWVLQGDFEGWQRTGAYVERIMNTDLLRYNAYTGIRNAGIIQVHAVLRHFRLSKLRVLADYVLARVAARSVGPVTEATAMPQVVRQHFSPMTAVRVLAFLDDNGYPLTAPVLSLQPAGEQALVCAEGLFADVLDPLPADTPVAASLLTLDAVSFQAQGRWLGTRRQFGQPVGALAVTAVYAGGPPIPGRQVA